MDETNDENINNNNNSVDNQMNTNSSFGKKRFFNRRLNSEPIETNVIKLESKKSLNKWTNNSLNNSNTNGLSNDLNSDKFSGDGIQFNAKLIGHEFVAEARGEHMCQQSLKKLKILQRGIGGHKRRIIIFISIDGIKIRDANTSELVYHHSVPQISFISRDETDSRAFGYVFGSSTTGHQFIAIKTQKEAMPIMSAIGQLFAVTLKRKKNEIIEESVVNDAMNIENEEKSRRESSITLRASRSESPNVPSMPAPPPPTVSSVSLNEEPDFFTAFDPIDSVFESDFKVNKEKLDQMPITDVANNDPFASSFGSMSLSSGDWANFDEDNLSSNASPLQQSQNSFGDNLKNNGFGIPIVREVPKTQISSSFNDSSSSMALKELFASGHHNQHNNFSEFNVKNSEAMAIPQRIRPNNTPLASNNQSVGSTTSSADRYACFNEIHSISSSIFDSLCDQIAAEESLNPKENSTSSKSLNSSLNGGFGFQHQLSSSYTGNYFSFDNPLNNPNNTINNKVGDQFDSNLFNNEPNAQNWNNSNANLLSNVWSTSSSVSPSEKSVANSQWSSTSSPPHSSGLFMNRANDVFNEAPVFAELDPLAKDKPFVDKTLFFADQKQKPTLRDLNSEFSSNSGSTGSNSPTIIEQKNTPSIELSSQAFNVNVNPFNDNNKQISGDVERCSPNPFNPFNICDPNTRPTPPPRPPSRECPPVPPRNDLIRGNTELAPPLPRRRTTIDHKSSLESQQCLPNRCIDPFISHYNTDNSSPPPIPNPLRKTQPKSSSNWDPFNCAFVESQLSSIASNSYNNKVINILSDDELRSSTPKISTNYVPPLRKDLKLSEIQSQYNWVETNDEINKDTNNSSSETSVFSDNFVYNNNNNENNSNDKKQELTNSSKVGKTMNNTEDNDRDNHISPPERNIFIPKSDPFADDFFAD